MRTGIAVIMTVMVVGDAACRDEVRIQSSGPAASGAIVVASQPRMRSLRVADSDGAPPLVQADAAPTVNGSNQAQVLNVRASTRSISQRQDSGGNTQILNIDATGGSVTQRQTGSGNFQSMNIGITDHAPLTAATPKQ
jgi:hypothetical protein